MDSCALTYGSYSSPLSSASEASTPPTCSVSSVATPLEMMPVRDLFRQRRWIVLFVFISHTVYMLNQSLCLFQIRSQPKEVISVSFPHM